MNKEAHEPVSPTHDLRKALEGIADDYMTSERHHPGYVLIPTAKFEQLCAAEKLLPPKPQCGAHPECGCVAEGSCGETETLAHPQQGWERDGWKPISEARHDCTLYELEVPSDGKGLRDAETSITIGSNNGDHDGEDRWTYAGWSWCQDRYIHMDTADGAPMPIRFREIRPDHLGRSASEPDPAVSPGNGHHLSYSGKPMPPDGIEGCVYCGQPFKEGDLVLSEVEGGEGHVTCMGPERDSYVGADGEPLKDGEPIPTGRPWIPTSTSKSSGEEA